MKTKDGHYSIVKVEKQYSKLKEVLNEHELSELVHLLVNDKCYLVKTINLISEHMKEA